MFPLIMAGVMAAQSFQKGKEAKTQAKIDKFTMKQNVKLENDRRTIDNIMVKAKGDLARYQQAYSNKYKLQGGADSIEAQRTTLLRLADASVQGSFESRIAASEVAGALAAQSGFAGVGGGSLQMIEAANTMRFQRADELRQRQTDQQLYDGERNIEQTLESTVLGLDNVQFFDNINYMTAQESYIKEPSWLEIGGNAAMTFAQSYTQMGGFDGLGGKIGGLFGQQASGSNQAGYSSKALAGWKGPTTVLK